MSTRMLIAAGCLCFAAMPAMAEDPVVVQIGVVDALLEGVSKGQRDVLTTDFAGLADELTMIKSAISLGGNHLAAARHLEAGQWHLAVFPGVEFAWAQASYPKLQPLMVATYKTPNLHALLMAKKTSSAAGFGDLKGKPVAILQSRQHCRLFAHKGAQGSPADFFGNITKTDSVEEALDDVLLGKVEAAIVDTSTLKIYEEIHPGRFAHLKELVRLEQFPSSVIAYYQGNLSEGMLTKWKDGMLKANRSDKGREVMGNFRITTFEPVPANYQETVASVLKAYPPPPEK